MRVFVLGAPDPEMSEIERVLDELGETWRFACVRGSRVRADNAYQADSLNQPLPMGAELVFVECAVMGLRAGTLIDHHHPGDPGYGMPPERYLEGSSLGQTLTLLGLEPSEEQRIIAAADHCPTQAYRGACPGVPVEALAAWRTRTRAMRRGVSLQEMENAIEEARAILEAAPKVDICGESIAFVEVNHTELSEASARYGIPFMYLERHRHQRPKFGILGGKPTTIRTWMAECGLAGVYGDPMRGYAGGYVNA